MSRSLAFLFAFFATATLCGQANYQVRWYSADNNHLPQNSVKSIAEDRYGYIWLSTENGVVRYDGANFNVYNTANIKGLASDRMVSFYGNAASDSLFINSENEETLLVNRRRVVKTSRKMPATAVKVSKPFYMLNRETVIGKHFSQRNEFFKLLSSDGYYTVGNDTIRRYKGSGRLLWQQAFRYPEASQFFTVGEKLYLLSGTHHYFEFSRSGHQKKSLPREAAGGTAYTNPAARQSFIYARGALYLLSDEKGGLAVKLLLEGFEFPAHNIISAYYDTEKKILYAGSYSRGLAVIRTKGFAASTRQGSDGVYYAILPFGKDRAVTSTGDIFGSGGYQGSLNFGKKTDKYMLVHDREGNLWTKEYRTLYRFSKSSGYRKSDSWVLPDRITTIGAVPDGRILISTQTGPGAGQLYTMPVGSLAGPAFFRKVPFVINCMSFPTAVRAYLGSERGLHELELSQGKCRDIYTGRDVYVRSIFMKSGNEVWATTYNKGFFLYRNAKVTRFPLDRNNYLHASHCIAEDKAGFFWIPTNRGLFQMKRQELLDYAEKKTDAVYYHYYDKDDGFRSNEFNGGCQPCAASLDDAAIFFPSLNGIVRFRPDLVRPTLPAGRLYVDQADVDGTAIVRTDTIRLDRDFNRIRFQISSPYFGNPYNQHIEYRLSGPVQQRWTALSAGQIAFSRLPPGDYHLIVRKNTGFGSRYEYLNIVLQVPAPFWQAAWFYAGVLVAAAGLVYLFTGIRMRYVRYKNRLLERQVALQTGQLQDTINALKKTKVDLDRQVKTHNKLLKTIAHDIKSPLRFINLTGRYIYQDPSSVPIREEVEAIYTSSEQLYHFVDNFLENAKSGEIASRSQPYALKDLVDEKMSFFRSIARTKNLALRNQVPDGFLTSANRHLLSIILHNLLDNAIKYTDAGSASFRAFSEGTRIRIELQDTGKGMTHAQVAHYQHLAREGNAGVPAGDGVGLSIVTDLVHVLGGGIAIESSQSGTRITVTLPQED